MDHEGMDALVSIVAFMQGPSPSLLVGAMKMEGG